MDFLTVSSWMAAFAVIFFIASHVARLQGADKKLVKLGFVVATLLAAPLVLLGSLLGFLFLLLSIPGSRM